MPIELKCNNYYSKVFKRVNYKLSKYHFLSSNQESKLKFYSGWTPLATSTLLKLLTK